VVSALARTWGPRDATGAVLQTLNFLFSFGLVTLLFAMIYKILPAVRIAWRDVIIGSIITALLFSVGKFLIGLYLGNSAVASTYGAAGSVVLLLIWVYYSTQIFLLGAEFTKVYAHRYGSKSGTRSESAPVN
jgi:membrane protein